MRVLHYNPQRSRCFAVFDYSWSLLSLFASAVRNLYALVLFPSGSNLSGLFTLINNYADISCIQAVDLEEERPIFVLNSPKEISWMPSLEGRLIEMGHEWREMNI